MLKLVLISALVASVANADGNTGASGSNSANTRFFGNVGGLPHVGGGLPHVGGGLPHVGGGLPHVGGGLPHAGNVGGFPGAGGAFPGAGVGVGGGFPGAGGVFPGAGVGVGGGFPGAGGVFPGVGVGVGGFQGKCNYCQHPITRRYGCCKPGRCPVLRPTCTRGSGAPQSCTEDLNCFGTNKCCPDACLAYPVCKPIELGSQG